MGADMTPDEELQILRADWAALVAQVTGGEGANLRRGEEHPNSVMRQALEALEERYVGALRDNAIVALRAALAKEAK